MTAVAAETSSMMVFHTGGTVGMSPLSGTRNLNLSTPLIAQLPRYHAGLNPDERVGVFQTGERILSRAETKEYNRSSQQQASNTNVVNMTVNAMDADSFNSKLVQSKEIIAAALMQVRSSNHSSRRN